MIILASQPSLNDPMMFLESPNAVVIITLAPSRPNNGRMVKHADLTYNRVSSILDKSKTIFFDDIQPSRILNAISKLYKEKTEKIPIDDGSKKKYKKRKVQVPLSIKSRNYCLRAFKHFLNWMVEDQRIDFHVLRHSFITSLVKGGVSPKVAQALARHSKITLTMDTYSHLNIHDHRSALDSLAKLSGFGIGEDIQEQAIPKTGTDAISIAGTYKPA